ncbi:MAG: chloride channel protein [Fidelibacterota bacterium]
MNDSQNRTKYKRLRKYIWWRNAVYSVIQRSLIQIKSFDQLFVIIIAMIIGIISGYGAAGFRFLIDFFRSISWYGDGSFVEIIRTTPFYLKIGIPIIGGVIVALFVNRFAPEAKGHGVPEVMDAVATKNGFIRMRVVLVKALASALSIGSGAAVGREGPIVQIGSAFGSSMGQLFQVSTRRMKTFIGCGAAAGIAATFNAPIAGAIFASEVIIGDFSVAAIGPIIISSVFGTVISRSIYGDFPAFIPPVYTLQSPFEIIFYIALGIVTGLAGWLFVKSLYFSEDIFDNLELPISIKAAIGGAFLGLLALFIPETLGVGYESMDRVLSGNMPYFLAGALLFGKIFATSLSLGSGASGGIFAPSLFMGSMLGGTLGSFFHAIYPEITASSGAYALVGMAAMVAATTHAPITAILIIFEMTSEYTVILPLMVTSIIATVITTRMLDGNIYTIKLKRRGIDIHGGTAINILDQLKVDKIKQQLLEVIQDDATLEELLERMSISSQSIYYVCDSQKKLSGIITQGMVRRFLNRLEEIPLGATVSDISNTHFPKIKDHAPVHEVLRLMFESDILAIPVVDDQDVLTGQVLREDVLREYQEMLIQSQSVGYLASSMKFVHKYYHEKTEVIPGFLMARINAPTEFVRQTFKSLKVRNKYSVDVLLIRKSNNGRFIDIMPKPNTMIELDDQLLIFGKKKDVETICQLS